MIHQWRKIVKINQCIAVQYIKKYGNYTRSDIPQL
jgi:hypothetical protein